MTRNDWFTVDVDGLADLAERRSPAWWIYELLQNAWDEPGVTEVSIDMSPDTKDPDIVHVGVEDNAPAGWANLEEARTLFARSKKSGDPELRGRFNLGEKLFLSICRSARISSTTGSIGFGSDGRVRSYPHQRRDHGTLISAKVMVDPSKLDALATLARQVIPPRGVRTVIAGFEIPERRSIGSVRGSLPTEYAGEDGKLRRTERRTSVVIYPVEPGETPTIFEMGIPVCSHAGDHHIDVCQVVPLGMERDSVTPTYARRLYALVLEAVIDQLDETQTSASWVTQGMDRAKSEVVAKTVEKRFGPDAVAFTPSAPESNKEAMAAGRTVIPPGALDREAWAAVRRARNEGFEGLAPSAASEFPTDVEHKTGGKPPIEPSEWSTEMQAVAIYAELLAAEILGVYDLRVRFYDVDNGYAGWWTKLSEQSRSRPTLSINLGGGMFPTVHNLDRFALDAFLIHEFAHHYADDHLSHAFHDACCRIGARLRTASTRLSR